ncbi:WhiB family transcriptional regulator [Streptomyces sp. NPDC001068]|uniref:WhiB family transcriptional regulator n=1 Tax=Streptomyces sp. NPDC001068 TaxID=3364544 RepID=UPI00367EAB2E
MDWIHRGLCRAQPERMFVEGTAQNDAKIVCVTCPVRLDCLAYALDHREQYGVWGAMTERERRALLRRRPGVTSWAEIFRAARTREDVDLVDGPHPMDGQPAGAVARPARAADGPGRTTGEPGTRRRG